MSGGGATWVLLARSGDDDSLAALASCAASAAAMGIEVRVVWDGAALARLVEGRLASLRTTRPDAALLFAEAAPLPVTHFACSAAAAATGGAAAVAPHVRELVGWVTIVAWIRDAERTLSF